MTVNASLSTEELETIRRRAVDAVRAAVTGAPLPGWPRDVSRHPHLTEPRAIFVTLRRHGRLRGCIGTLEAIEPLLDAVDDRARAAALHDPRFDAVQPSELPDIEVEVSILSPPEPVAVDSWAELSAALRPGTDGVVVDDGRHRATFLPAVWDELPTPEEFLDRLWEKAGMVPRDWTDRTRISRYSVQRTG